MRVSVWRSLLAITVMASVLAPEVRAGERKLYVACIDGDPQAGFVSSGSERRARKASTYVRSPLALLCQREVPGDGQCLINVCLETYPSFPMRLPARVIARVPSTSAADVLRRTATGSVRSERVDGSRRVR